MNENSKDRKPFETRICICCGEPMPARVGTSSINPNVCDTCSAISDAIDPRTWQLHAVLKAASQNN